MIRALCERHNCLCRPSPKVFVSALLYASSNKRSIGSMITLHGRRTLFSHSPRHARTLAKRTSSSGLIVQSSCASQQKPAQPSSPSLLLVRGARVGRGWQVSWFYAQLAHHQHCQFYCAQTDFFCRCRPQGVCCLQPSQQFLALVFS